jgi:cupin fold WbuC family metalloprotein
LQAIKVSFPPFFHGLPQKLLQGKMHPLTLTSVLIQNTQKRISNYFWRKKMKQITSSMCDEWVAMAGRASRLRVNYNIHEQLSDPVQKLFIAAKPSSYFRPHRHPLRSEFALVIRGRFDVLVFNDEGIVTERIVIGADTDAFGLEIPADVWHTWIPRDDSSVFFEVKQGPYDPATSMQFAVWSPEEGTGPVKEFQNKLLYAKIGESVA